MHGGNVWAGYTSARRRLLGIGLVLGLVFISACSAATGASNAALAGSGGDAFRAFVITDDGGAPSTRVGSSEPGGAATAGSSSPPSTAAWCRTVRRAS